ncbi:Alpha/Beta hydrolase protein [Xylogone sp. PMI_703]|nr:Alpha/Beta hydrolase protein [Xylogone sp. PMI_703]
MSLQSDITINAAKFDPASISEETTKFNQLLIDKFGPAKKWWDVGAAKFREMRRKGETFMAVPVLHPDAINIEVPSREQGRSIPCRLMYPSSRRTEEDRKKCKGTILHIHGGGWVLGDHESTDRQLLHYADSGDVAVLSVGYRLAPEYPFPAGPEDCYDVAEYLAKNSAKEYGGPLRFIGGESAGGHLSLLTAFHLLRVAPDLRLSGLLLHFGCFDMSLLPQARYYSKPLVLNNEGILKTDEVFLPGMPMEQKKTASISPFYEDLSKLRGRLPSALFTCGTDDPLLDDSVLMGTKWLINGGEAYIKIYPGGAHAFIGFPIPIAAEAMSDTAEYIRERMART